MLVWWQILHLGGQKLCVKFQDDWWLSHSVYVSLTFYFEVLHDLLVDIFCVKSLGGTLRHVLCWHVSSTFVWCLVSYPIVRYHIFILTSILHVWIGVLWCRRTAYWEVDSICIWHCLLGYISQNWCENLCFTMWGQCMGPGNWIIENCDEVLIELRPSMLYPRLWTLLCDTQSIFKIQL